MVTVYFHQKGSHRERQRDTYHIGSTLVSSVTKLDHHENNLQIEKGGRALGAKFITKLLALIPIINVRLVYPRTKTDYLYTWGDIPLFPRSPYVVEIDNPGILTLYNAFALKIYAPVIRFLLSRKSCSRIVCISSVCREVFLATVGKGLDHKTVVLYPFVRKRENVASVDGKVRFLSVTLRRIGKGVNETLSAFHRLSGGNLELHVVGWNDAETQSRYASDPRIIFHGPLSRDKVLNQLMPSCDVLVFPSVYESLGMVALEALSAGLGIITTDTFALRDMVKNDHNGILLKNPYIPLTTVKTTSLVNVTAVNPWKLYKNHGLTEDSMDSQFEREVYSALVIAKERYALWKKCSNEIFEQQFSEQCWKRQFMSLFSPLGHQ